MDDVVRLEPLAATHAAALREAAAGPREAYAFASVPTPGSVDAFVAESLARAAAGTHWPLVQVDARDGRVVGCTAYLSPRRWPDGRLLAIEIGSTWLNADAQGTAINTAAKRLLLTHAFDVLGVVRVDLKTDARNARSRAGIEAIGARLEGVLRSWQPSAAPGEAGLARDTAMHSITVAEWPAVRARLDGRLAAKRAGLR